MSLLLASDRKRSEVRALREAGTLPTILLVQLLQSRSLRVGSGSRVGRVGGRRGGWASAAPRRGAAGAAPIPGAGAGRLDCGAPGGCSHGHDAPVAARQARPAAVEGAVLEAARVRGAAPALELGVVVLDQRGQRPERLDCRGGGSRAGAAHRVSAAAAALEEMTPAGAHGAHR